MNSNEHLPIQAKNAKKLIKSFPKYLLAIRSSLIRQFGEDQAMEVLMHARQAYPAIVPKIHSYQTPMYDALMVQASKMALLLQEW